MQVIFIQPEVPDPDADPDDLAQIAHIVGFGRDDFTSSPVVPTATFGYISGGRTNPRDAFFHPDSRRIRESIGMSLNVGGADNLIVTMTDSRVYVSSGQAVRRLMEATGQDVPLELEAT